MLSRLILLLLQARHCLGRGALYRALHPGLGRLQLFVYAAVFAVLVWVVGLVLSQVLRETGQPSSATLVAALVVALIGAAIVHVAAGGRAGRARAACAPSPSSPIR